jgi:hypothetical protein
VHTSLSSIFGDRTSELQETVLESVRTTHELHAAGQQLMDPDGRRGYGGSIWVKLPNNLCHAVEKNFLDASIWRGGHSGYSLPVLNGCVLYVWRTPGGKPAAETKFLTSSIRSRLIDGVSQTQGNLFESFSGKSESEDAPTAGVLEAQRVAAEVDRDGLRLILIVVESTPERLHQVKWGEVARGAEDDLKWLSEGIIHSSEDQFVQPTSVSERTFAEGAPPAAIVESRFEATNNND